MTENRLLAGATRLSLKREAAGEKKKIKVRRQGERRIRSVGGLGVDERLGRKAGKGLIVELRRRTEGSATWLTHSV